MNEEILVVAVGFILWSQTLESLRLYDGRSHYTLYSQPLYRLLSERKGYKHLLVISGYVEWSHLLLDLPSLPPGRPVPLDGLVPKGETVRFLPSGPSTASVRDRTYKPSPSRGGTVTRRFTSRYS